jgi:hypothetical protein
MDESLLNRVADATARFNDALHATQIEETRPHLHDLADAADVLMRAVGRVLIEAKRDNRDTRA